MRFVVLLCLLVPLAAQRYTSKYDNIDVDAILKNDRILNRYIDCMMDRGRCTPEATELKRSLPDAMATQCAKCTEKQRVIMSKVLSFMLQYKRPVFLQLADKYDPDGTFRKEHGFIDDNAPPQDYEYDDE